MCTDLCATHFGAPIAVNSIAKVTVSNFEYQAKEKY